ncbi:MAG TPA: hemerythrin domain-containing protein [Gammaproteobacteria bacterium]|nr:hemerythrin domain-containing protein [Gammaproteobacteria bacterium]
MYSLEELKKQNEDIAELCDVLSVLVKQKSLRNNAYLCELMTRFKEKVWMHLVFEDNTIYAQLARHQDKAISETARSFHDSAREVRQCFSRYARHWCHPVADDGEQAVLQHDSDELFRLVKARIQYENEHIFPLIADH